MTVHELGSMAGQQQRREVSFFVPGRPQTAGSKSVIPAKNEGDKPLIVDSGNRGDKRAWRADLRAAALAAIEPVDLWSSNKMPVEARFVFVVKRPQAHLDKVGNVKARFLLDRPAGRPDALKLARAAEDALTGIMWDDDAAIVSERLDKVYGDQAGLMPRAEGAIVVVREAGEYQGPRLARAE